MKSVGTRYWRDPFFWLAAAAAPLTWLCMIRWGVQPRTAALPISALLMLVVVSPILEEIVFRGSLQAYLYKRPALRLSVCGISLANIITSVIFAAFHLIRQTPVWAALVFVPSLVFGWARDRYQTLIPPIILHMFYNAGFIWLFG